MIKKEGSMKIFLGSIILVVIFIGLISADIIEDDTDVTVITTNEPGKLFLT